MACICCSGGTHACVVPSCLTFLDLGTTTEANGSKLWFRIRNDSTGVIEQVEVTVASGHVIAPVWLLPESFINSFAFFSMWVTRQDDQTGSPLQIIPEGTIYPSTCFEVQFEDVYMGDDKWNYQGLTIKLEV